MKYMFRSLSLLLLLMPVAAAQQFADSVRMFTLDNGMRIIMVQQGAAPTITFNLMFDVGAIDEPDGLGGLAHMVEHMAFQGTRSIGAVDLARELELLDRLEVLVAAIDQAERAGFSEDELADMHGEFAAVRQEAQAIADTNALSALFSTNGGVGLNASTGYDRTDYRVALPSNRLELYARIYADVMRNPIFRSFYEERDVVMEERRQVREDDPQGLLAETFLATAFAQHPYGRSLIGTSEEIMGYRATEARAFWELYYHPGRAVLVMVGDVNPDEDIAIIERYFGTVPAGPELRVRIDPEPVQQAERRGSVAFDAEPQIYVGFHKPTYPDRDAYVLDVISALLSRGRSSRLFRRMVIEDQIATVAATSASFPGIREANLFVFYGQPRFPHTTEDLEVALYEELERLQNELVSERELQRVKNQVRASFIRNLGSAAGLANQLAFYELFLGGWENLEAYADIIDSISAEDIMNVAQRYFHAENRSVATLISSRIGDE